MKKYIVLLTAFLLVLLSVSCGQETPSETAVTYNFGGENMTVTFAPGNRSAGTITSEKGAYTFAYETGGDLKIIYPDGSRFTWKSSGIGTSSIDFDPTAKGYPDGITMAWGIESAIERAYPSRSSGDANPLLAVFLLALGAWNAFAPRSAWYLARGWQFKNAEPSDAALGMHVLGGIVLLIAGVICLLAAIL